MDLFNKSLNIQWCPFLLNGDWHNTGYLEPESLIKHLVKIRDKDVEYFKCPAFQEYYKNTFVIKCPIDLKLEIKKHADGSKYILTHKYSQQFTNDHIFSRLEQNKSYSMYSLEFNYIFYSKDSVNLQMIPASLDHTDFLQNNHLVPGEFNISKWIRPIAPAFEVKNDEKYILLKRGDPLYYIKFNTKRNVVLERVEQSETIEKIEKACARLKFYVPKNSLEENYRVADSFINLHKDKLFKKKKCPFKFWKGN